MDFYGFYTGQEFEAYKYLGAHPAKAGTAFRTFAPKASKISVIGDFSQWQELEMKRIYDGNFWEGRHPRGPARHALQVPHLPGGRHLSGPLRSLRLLRRAQARHRLRHRRPLPHLRGPEMDARPEGTTPSGR